MVALRYKSFKYVHKMYVRIFIQPHDTYVLQIVILKMTTSGMVYQ